ncbi:MAG: glycosyltransferase, partial [Nitrospinae bacterium]|nr:glycosyltransferase [Nitrospinota bacterium]
GSGQQWIVDRFADLARRRPDRVGVSFTYDEGLAHLVEAGSDLFLMPSVYEPCGLNQLYSLAYGTPPVVRATGGLNDTVVPFDPATGRGNGFKFVGGMPHDLFDCASAALDLYHHNRAAWDTMVANGMAEDHSWSAAAGVYEGIYHAAVQTALRRNG